ncbi:heavy metal translocating P-type ATPase [Alteromonas flava]|uniref:heavy metal translocating P-type ATPase n=1 Tax=Alteromonas flava TaxID=2048003 RepID=UPI000C2928E5|nr:heavy metal translocating P-type ATPase [Alteromonas flava]
MEASASAGITSVEANTVCPLSNAHTPCFHCGLPNFEGEKYTVVIAGESQAMCCPGCQTVAQSIVDNGLEDYYTIRTEPAAKGDEVFTQTLDKLALFDEPDVQEEFVHDNRDTKQIQLTVEGINCAACGWLIEKQMAKTKGIIQISVNVSTRRALVDWDPTFISLSSIIANFQKIGYRASPFQPDKHEALFHAEQKSLLKKVGLAGIMTMQVMMLMTGLYFDLFGNIDHETRQYFYWVSLVLTTPVVLYSGSIFYISAAKALAMRSVNMDVPVTLAIFGTYIAGIKATILEVGDVYFESICMFVFFLLLSRFLEHRARHKAAMISANMLQYMPVSATLLEGNSQHSVLAKLLVPEQIVLVKPGEVIPVDGIVIDGESQVNESMLNGEFEPAYKVVNSQVYGGTVNQSGSLSIRVTSKLKDALVNQIVLMQEAALATKPRIAHIADRFSRFFVTAVLIISALTFGFWTWIGNDEAFWITIAVLVATCPCALGLATPSALTCAMARLNKAGVVLKRADALEQINTLDTVILDKTGTLTEGEFSIHKQWIAPAYSGLEPLIIAATLESRSEHPIAQAFAGMPSHSASDISITIGQGIQGTIDGRTYRIGSRSFVTEHVSNAKDYQSIADIDTANVWLTTDEGLIAIFWLNDTLKENVATTLQRIPFDKVLLSGDTQANVELVAGALGIKQCHAQQSPQQKLSFVERYQAQGHSVMMVGDGVNDAPVLAKADISIAVGNASDLAKSSADVVLLNESISIIPELIDVARQTQRTIKQNMAWSLGYNLLILPFAVSGVLAPWMAALGMSLSSIIVVVNSTRLLRNKAG